MIFWMIFGVNAVALVIVLIYFLTQRRQTQEIWHRFRKRQIERRGNPLPDQSSPVFQFDRPNASMEEDELREPN